MIFLKHLNQLKRNARICLYGSGGGSDAFEYLIKENRNDIEIVLYADSFVQGNKKKNNIPIINVKQLKDHVHSFDKIVVTSAYWEEISKTLKNNGFKDFFVADHTSLSMLVVCVVSYKCNLRCRHCWNFNNIHIVPKDHLTNELSVDQWEQILFQSKLLRNPNTILALEGGEIFHLENYHELLSMISKLPLNHPINIITNGSYPDRVERVIKTTDLGEKAWFMISIDGMKETHDRIRGIGTFDNALKTIDILKDNGCKVSIGTCVQRQNIHELEEIRNFFREKCDGHGFGMESESTEYIDFSSDEIEMLKDYLTPDMIDLLQNGDEIRSNTTCTAGITKARIEPNGTVIACINSFHSDPIVLGDLKQFDFNFDKLWNSENADQARDKVRSCSNCISFCER